MPVGGSEVLFCFLLFGQSIGFWHHLRCKKTMEGVSSITRKIGFLIRFCACQPIMSTQKMSWNEPKVGVINQVINNMASKVQTGPTIDISSVLPPGPFSVPLNVPGIMAFWFCECSVQPLPQCLCTSSFYFLKGTEPPNAPILFKWEAGNIPVSSNCLRF